MSRIAVIWTGGTIGSQVEDGVADVPGKSSRQIIRRYQEAHPGSSSVFLSIEPLCVLSENMTPREWSVLLDALRGLDWASLDGVIVTHGTDTLAYTAQLLAVALAGIDRPVFLVSSHTPPDDPDANGHRHFAAAVAWIESGRAAGVFVPVSDGERVAVTPAASLTQCAGLTDRFGLVPARPIRPPAGEPLLWRLPPLRARVQMIRPYPGLDYRSVALLEETRAVLIELYHSGTACMTGEYTGLPSLAARCRKAGIPLLACPVPDGAAYQYASARAMGDLGVRLLPGLPLERGYVLLTLAFSLYGEEDGALRWLEAFL